MGGLTRTLLLATLAAAGAGSPADAQQDLHPCRAVKAGAERLKCFDAATPAESAEADADPRPAWTIAEDKSPMDDSPTVFAVLRSTDGRSSLIVQCTEKVTNVIVRPADFVSFERDGAPVTYRLRQERPSESRWHIGTSGRSVYVLGPIVFLKDLHDDDRFVVRVLDERRSRHETVFELGNVSDARARVAQACSWDAPTPTGVKSDKSHSFGVPRNAK